MKLNYDNISSMFFILTIINNVGNYVKICWKSKSGRIYKVDDNDIDCNDIEFWFEGLNVKLIHQQMYPKLDMPFQFKELPFELQIERLNMECPIDITFNSNGLANKEAIEKQINDFLGKMVTKGTGGGFIHNFWSTWEGNICQYQIDTGSVGVIFIKKIVVLLQKINCFDKVLIH